MAKPQGANGTSSGGSSTFMWLCLIVMLAAMGFLGWHSRKGAAPPPPQRTSAVDTGTPAEESPPPDAVQGDGLRNM